MQVEELFSTLPEEFEEGVADEAAIFCARGGKLLLLRKLFALR
jgi:hypothetical protein